MRHPFPLFRTVVRTGKFFLLKLRWGRVFLFLNFSSLLSVAASPSWWLTTTRSYGTLPFYPSSSCADSDRQIDAFTNSTTQGMVSACLLLPHAAIIKVVLIVLAGQGKYPSLLAPLSMIVLMLTMSQVTFAPPNPVCVATAKVCYHSPQHAVRVAPRDRGLQCPSNTTTSCNPSCQSGGEVNLSRKRGPAQQLCRRGQASLRN